MTNDEVADAPNSTPKVQSGGEKLGAGESAEAPAAASSHDEEGSFARLRVNRSVRKIWNVVSWTPQRCRWDPESPPPFGMALNLLFAFAGTFTVANLYYSHPILNILAVEFDVSNEKASQVPTMAQAGYAAGLLFICPLGDIFRRRAFVLILVFFTATMVYVLYASRNTREGTLTNPQWLGLCLTKSFSVFLAISFITAVSTVTPQLMLPLVGDLAPPHRRATALSIVVSGLLLGMLIARLLSGILTQYTSWRSIYWFSFGVQYLIFILLFLFMPDYPSTNPGGINYLRILLSVLKMLFRHPVLVQACLIGFLTASTFTSYWTTLTFLLSSPPYTYDPVVIGLFALIGIGAICLGPFYSRAVIDRFVPVLSVVLGLLYCLVGVVIGTYTGRLTVAGPIIQAFAIDLGLQTSQIANRSAIYAIEPKARNRVNTAYMVCVFCGQLTGTAAGNRLYARGGWIASGSASVGMLCAALLLCFARSPWNPGWVGWKGGWSIRRRDLGPEAREEPAAERPGTVRGDEAEQEGRSATKAAGDAHR
ncbi:hypothetical protein PZA11_001416 [Diplocarpon coronariae]